MPHVILPGLLSRHANGPRVDIDGPTARDTLQALERRYPALRGWVLDEQGRVRAHVKLFVNGTEASLETNTSSNDELHIVPAISGG